MPCPHGFKTIISAIVLSVIQLCSLSYIPKECLKIYILAVFKPIMPVLYCLAPGPYDEAIHGPIPGSNYLKRLVEGMPISELNLGKIKMPRAVHRYEWPLPLHSSQHRIGQTRIMHEIGLSRQ